jgi:LPS sulfotransferase NodH
MKISKIRGYYRVNQTLKTIKRNWTIWKVYFSCFFKGNKPKQKKVIIFAQGRTGSTLLESLLSSTGCFESNGELLGHGMSKSIRFPLKYVLGKSKQSSSVKHFIFHLKIYHLIKDREKAVDPKWFLKELSDKGWFIIYLKRQNKLRHVLSTHTVKHRKGYHKTSLSEKTTSFEVDVNEIVNSIKGRIEYDNLEKEAIKDLNVLELGYETHLQNSNVHQKTVDMILDFLNLKSNVSVSTNLKRINTIPINHLVSNYDSLHIALKNNDMLNYLSD